MAGILNRGTIVSNGLELGGNTGLTTLANTFLNLMLDHLYRAEDWNFLRKVTTAQADASDFSKIPASVLPSTYRSVVNLRAPKSGNYMQQVPMEDLWLQRQLDADNSAAAVSSKPDRFAVDEGSLTSGVPDIYVYPKPDTRYTYDLIYQSLPAALSSDSDVPAFPDHLALVSAVAAWARDYEKDTLAAMAWQQAEKLLMQFRINHQDQGRANAQTIPFDTAQWKTRRSD